MQPNYYEILGVQPDVTLEALCRAYRQAAIKNHPDHGGSNAQMVLINEAYFILSDSAQRAEYDRVLARSLDNEMLAEWLSETQPIRDKARDYPKQWAQFEKWMEGFLSDLKDAKYGKEQIWGGISAPTIEGSQSGAVFIGVGAVLGIVVLGFLTGLYPAMVRVWMSGQPGSGVLDGMLQAVRHPIPKLVLLGAPGLLGAWLGQLIHRSLRDTLVGSTPPRASTNNTNGQSQGIASVEYESFACQKCGQKLRVPRLGKDLVVTCPKCGNKFTHGLSV
ncbi:MAG: DnaJ domain-containing protein [Planctomycetota bacterium]|nr:DnaJ domain-containing protein [Planctomycetota bacterium]